MTTTTIIDNLTAADTTVTGSISDGSSKTFGASGLELGESILIEKLDNGGTYSELRYLHESGVELGARLTPNINVIKINGPIDYRINKPVTTNGVSVVEYS